MSIFKGELVEVVGVVPGIGIPGGGPPGVGELGRRGLRGREGLENKPRAVVFHGVMLVLCQKRFAQWAFKRISVTCRNVIINGK